MELGIGMFGDRHVDSNGKVQPAHQRLQELLEQIKLMDELGIDFFGIGEHHREEYAVSAPEVVLAAAAAATRNIRLGSAVSVLSSADPVRLYQAYATVDALSGGRAELMVGRGSFTESFPLFGYNLQDYDTLFEEKLELLLQINKEPKINWQGKHRAPLVNQEVYPRAVNDHLDIWVAVGGTPESVVRGARLGLPVIFAIIGGNPAQFKPLFDYYRRAWQHFERPAETLQVGVHMHCFFGNNSQEAADSIYPQYAAQMNRIGRERGWGSYQRQQFEQGRGPQGALIIGDASEAVDKILYLHELFGLTRFAAHMDVGGPAHKDLMRSIEIYGTQIVPRIRKALEKNTAPEQAA